jgi:TPR repeat protein
MAAPSPEKALPPTPAAHAAVAAETSVASRLLPPAEIATLLTRGDAAFRDGDLTSARLYYLRAFGAGDGRGALGIGASYDPWFLRRFHLWTQRADPTEAKAWYVRARDLGSTEAESRLDRYKTRPPR